MRFACRVPSAIFSNPAPGASTPQHAPREAWSRLGRVVNLAMLPAAVLSAIESRFQLALLRVIGCAARDR